MNYGDEYLDVTSDNEALPEDYQQFLDSLPPITDGDLNQMSKAFNDIFGENDASTYTR
jgi:hypothetical protein